MSKVTYRNSQGQFVDMPIAAPESEERTRDHPLSKRCMAAQSPFPPRSTEGRAPVL